MPRRSWEQMPEYQFTEDNPNPKMRPALDKLISKLHTLSFLQNRPESVVYLIKDLAHYYLVREAKRPEYLWAVVGDVMYKFHALAGGWDWLGTEEPYTTDRKGEMSPLKLEKSGVGTGGNEEAQLWAHQTTPLDDSAAGVEPSLYKLSNWLKLSEKMKAAIVEVWTQGYADGRENEAKAREWVRLHVPASASAEPVDLKGRRGDSVSAEPFDYDDKRLKIGVEGVLIQHSIRDFRADRTLLCECGREYPNRTEWAKHVRIRIWRYMKDEFPSIGTDVGDAEG